MKGLFPTVFLPNKIENDDKISSWLVNHSFTYRPNAKLQFSKPVSSNPLPRNVHEFVDHQDILSTDLEFSKNVCEDHFENTIYFLDSYKDSKLLESGKISYFQIPKYDSKFESYYLSIGFMVSISRPPNFKHKRYFSEISNEDSYIFQQDVQTFDFSSSFIPLNKSVSPLLCKRQSLYYRNQPQVTIPKFEAFDPNLVNIQNWLEQFVPLAHLRISNDPYFSSDIWEAIFEAFESAFSFNPCYIPLISRFMSFYSLAYPYQKVLDKWRHFLFILPQFSRLWNEFIDFTSQCFDHYCTEDVISNYILAFTRLISILEGNLLSNPPEFESENKLIFLIIKYCCFLKNAGYCERAISSIISLIHFNNMKKLNNSDKESLIDEFIDNWNCNVTSTLRNDQTNKFLSEIPEFFSDTDYVIHNTSLSSKSWVDVECMKMDSWTFPNYNQRIINFEIDENKYTRHSELTPLFFIIRKERNSFQLLLHTLLIIGIPISFTSHVDVTYISDCDMIVKIDAKEWVSLSPLKFTGSLMISSTDTKNMSYKRSMLSKDQVSPLIDFLNYVMVTMDLECQTIILLIWFEFLINCLEYNITHKEFNQKIRSQMKVILAIDAHRNNLEIWSAYVIIQSYVSSLTKIFEIPIVFFTKYANNTEFSSEILLCVCILLHTCTIVERRFCIDTSTLELYFIDCLISKVCPDLTEILDYCHNISTKLQNSYSHYLVNKQILWNHLMHSFKKCSDDTRKFPFLFSTIFLHAEITLMNSQKSNEKCLVIGAIIDDITNSSLLFGVKKYLIEYVLYVTIYLIRQRIRLTSFPKSLAIALHKHGGNVINRSPCLYAFLIQSFKITDNIEVNSDDMGNCCYLGKISLQLKKIDQEENSSIKTNYMNLLGEVFLHAIVSHPKSCILWVAYLDYLTIMGNIDDMRLGFLQAVKTSPGVKHFYIQYLHTKVPDPIFTLSTMEEKGIRIYFPIEELVLIQKNYFND